MLQVVLDTPGLAQLAAAIGIPPAPISSVLPLTVSPLDPVLPFGDIPTYFNRYFFRPFSAVSTVTLAMIAPRIFSAGRESSQRHVKPIDLVLGYFWITAILHYLLSLSYCVDCIKPVYELLPPARGIGSGRVDRRNSSADG